MACVTKRRGKWVVDFYDQQKRRHWKTFDRRKDADAFLDEAKREVKRGVYQTPIEHTTFRELVQAYRKVHIDVQVRPTTRKDYNTLLDLHLLPYLGDMKIRLLNAESVEGLQAQLLAKGIGRRTVNKAHTMLGALLRYALKRRWVYFNVAAEVNKLRDDSPVLGDVQDENFLTPPEIRALLEAADEQWRPLLMMAVFTGLRQGELLGLKWADIDWNIKRVFVRRQYSHGRFADLKTRHARRTVDLNDELVHVLKLWRLRCPKGQDDLVFPNSEGRGLNHGIALRAGFYPALRRAKLRHVTFHGLRHTYASLLIHAGVNIKRVQRLMGHSSSRITLDIYGHLMSETDNEAAQRVAALVYQGDGSKMVAAARGGTPEVPQVIEKMEAGVGIEPAYTDLQSAA